jgi:Ni/Co efflux regulator RcnB
MLELAMNRHSLLAVLAASSMLGGPAFAQSSDFRQAEQDREAQRQRELQARPEYLPGDRRRIEQLLRDREAAQQHREPPRYRDGRPLWRESNDRRDDRGRGYQRDGYGDYRAEEWRHRGRGAGPNRDWYRGSYLPREYRSRHYVVDDWRAHRLYAPPPGHHWVQAGGDYVLAAIATGVIAAILLNQ